MRPGRRYNRIAKVPLLFAVRRLDGFTAFRSEAGASVRRRPGHGTYGGAIAIYAIAIAKGCPMNSQETHSSDPVLAHLAGLLPELETLYTDVHAHPELSMQETRTAGLAAERLRAAGYEVTTAVGKTGVVGLLRNGEGPTVMLRADMDALPVEEMTGLPYASRVRATDGDGKRVPVMHACGHDMHVAWLAGAITLFAQVRHTWRGTLMAVFQRRRRQGKALRRCR